MLLTSPLKKALDSFNVALKRSNSDPNDLEIRDACIQRFEYTYELSIKIIKRYIEKEMPIPENIDSLNYRDLLRIAFESGLVQNVENWFQYREARNQTSHAYDEKKAKTVYQILPEFFLDAQNLLAQIVLRLGKNT